MGSSTTGQDLGLRASYEQQVVWGCCYCYCHSSNFQWALS